MRTSNQNSFLLGAGMTLVLFAVWALYRPATSPPIQPPPLEQPAEPATAHTTLPIPTKPDTKEAKFQTLLRETTQHLVRSDEIRPGTALHDAPPETTRDSLQFGQIMDQVKANPAFVPMAMEFYENCALDEDVIAPTRAVCLAHLKYWSEKRGEFFNRQRYPKEILSTADKLPVQWN